MYLKGERLLPMLSSIIFLSQTSKIFSSGSNSLCTMWPLSNLAVAAFLTSTLLLQPTTCLESVFRDPDSLDLDDPNGPRLIGSSLHALPPWDSDHSWTKRSEDDL